MSPRRECSTSSTSSPPSTAVQPTQIYTFSVISASRLQPTQAPSHPLLARSQLWKPVRNECGVKANWKARWHSARREAPFRPSLPIGPGSGSWLRENTSNQSRPSSQSVLAARRRRRYTHTTFWWQLSQMPSFWFRKEVKAPRTMTAYSGLVIMPTAK